MAGRANHWVAEHLGGGRFDFMLPVAGDAVDLFLAYDMRIVWPKGLPLWGVTRSTEPKDLLSFPGPNVPMGAMT